MELIQDPLVAKIQDAINVMVARSKTTGGPYDLSYEQLADIIDFPGPIGQKDIEHAMDNNPSLAGYISNFDEAGLEVDSNAQSLPDASSLDAGGSNLPPLDLSNSGLPPPDMSTMGLGTAPAAPAAPAAPVVPPIEAPTGPSVVQQMADRATKRRMK